MTSLLLIVAKKKIHIIVSLMAKLIFLILNIHHAVFLNIHHAVRKTTTIDFHIINSDSELAFLFTFVNN